jgi:sigma-B regulation protein RsbU (phosphoserine phosphatase)
VRILIAEDDAVSRRLLEASLPRWGYEVVTTGDGQAAWEALQRPDAPRLALLDWMMPHLPGPEVCRRVRAVATAERPYLILLTGRGEKADVVAGLDSGADDYLTKPFDREELRARLQAGRRLIELQRSLAERVRELEQALVQVRHLQRLLPICCYCKRIRGDGDYWQQVEAYLAAHAEVRFSHSICPDCWARTVAPDLEAHGIKPPRDE